MPKAKQTNAIEKMVQTSQGATVKTVSTKASLTELEIVELGTQAGSACLAIATASEQLNTVATNAHNGGLRLIDLREAKSKPEQAKQTRLFKSAFEDAMTKAGKSKATIQNYYELVAKGINSGKPIKSTNPSMTKGKGKAKGKGGKAGGDVLAIALKLYLHNDTSLKFSEEFIAELDDVLSEAGLIEDAEA